MPAERTLANPIPANRQEACEVLRARHPRFVYEGFSLECRADALGVKFRFRIEPDLEFSPETWIENVEPQQLASLSGGLLENLVFHLGLIEMLSYWKAACSPEIVVRAVHLDAEQIRWWMDLLVHGMGEFFYVNQIRFDEPDFVRIVSEPPREREMVPASAGSPWKSGSIAQAGIPDLVLTSGGKDSVVTLELLREAGLAFDCLLLNPAPAAVTVARQAECRQARIVRRSIDGRLLELNRAGYLNGHTPFSALLAFLGVTVAALTGAQRVIVANERSAEEASAQFLGREVNHQYSKSFAFETAFCGYAQNYLVPGIDYFSLLRPLYELQIAAWFAHYRQYFPLFRSCNRGMATNSWCGRCPKCLFVFLALCPFLDRKQLLGIFGQDLFIWEGATPVLEALLGLDCNKPFECVGTKEETMAALYLCIQKYKELRIELPSALREIERKVLVPHPDLPERARRVLTAWTDQHCLPPELAAVLRKHLGL